MVYYSLIHLIRCNFKTIAVNHVVLVTSQVGHVHLQKEERVMSIEMATVSKEKKEMFAINMIVGKIYRGPFKSTNGTESLQN